MRKERLHIGGHQLGAAGLKAGAGDAGGDHKEHGEGEPFRLIQHVLDAVRAAGVGDLVGVGNHRCGALLQHTVGKAGGMGHGRFDMHVTIDETGAQIGPFCVDFLPAGVVADAEDDPIADGDVPLLDGPSEHVDYVGVFDDQGGVA